MLTIQSRRPTRKRKHNNGMEIKNRYKKGIEKEIRSEEDNNLKKRDKEEKRAVEGKEKNRGKDARGEGGGLRNKL